jgi:hypothetical protein
VFGAEQGSSLTIVLVMVAELQQCSSLCGGAVLLSSWCFVLLVFCRHLRCGRLRLGCWLRLFRWLHVCGGFL